MTDVFTEVEEELRQERYLTLAKKYGVFAAGGIVAVLAGVGGYLAYDHFSTQARHRQSEAFAAAQELLQQGNAEAARTAFQAVEGGVYRDLAALYQAALLVEAGDLQGAIAAFDQAAQGARDPILRDTARLRAAYLVADTQDFAALEARATPLLEAPGPLSALAKELLAIEAWEAGDTERARALFLELTLDLDTPDDVRQRAQGLALAVLGPAPEAAAPEAAESTSDTGASQ